MNFLRWLKKQYERMDRVGDIAKDVVNDVNINDSVVYDFKSFIFYLDKAGACDSAIDALCVAYVEFMDYRHETETLEDERLHNLLKEQEVNLEQYKEEVKDFEDVEITDPNA